AAVAPPPAGSDPTAAAPPPTVDDLTYFDRLQKSSATAGTEDLKRVEKPPTASAPASKPAPREAASPVEVASAEPAGEGYAVQVAAFNVRGEADAIARRLSSKGYAAYVLSPATGTPQVFRVRVGKFGTRREAETIAVK